jgi:hypothetical protein
MDEKEVDSLAPALALVVARIDTLAYHHRQPLRLLAGRRRRPGRTMGSDRVAAGERLPAAHAILIYVRS